MRKSKLPNIAILKAVEAGRTVKDVVRARDQRRDLLTVELEVRRHGSRRHSLVA
ncbi:MAG: hypothetical protein LC794_20545 [Acidobacteria bacterium]|nr:hypothetical protein [Acidobacteriota bacterium]